MIFWPPLLRVLHFGISESSKDLRYCILIAIKIIVINL